jgi:hypothetical protein
VAGALEAWEVERNQQALLAITAAAGQSAPMAVVASALAERFNCPAAIWEREPPDRLRLAATSADPDLAALLSSVASEEEDAWLVFAETTTEIDTCPLTTLDGAQVALRGLGYRQLIRAQLGAAGEALGAITLFATRPVAALQPDAHVLLQAARQVTGQLLDRERRSRALEALTQATASLAALTQFLAEGAAVNNHELRQALAERLREAMGADSAILIVFRPGSMGEGLVVEEVCLAGALRDPGRLMRTPYQPNSPLARVAESPDPIYAEDVLQHYYGGHAIGDQGIDVFPVREGIASSFAARLWANGRALGVAFANYREPHPPTPHEKAMFELLVSLAAIGLWRAEVAALGVSRP